VGKAEQTPRHRRNASAAFAHPFISALRYEETFRKERSGPGGHPGRTADRRIDAHRSRHGLL